MGMLIGELTGKDFFNKPIYQAVILNKAFEGIEFDYPHQIHGIEIFDPEIDYSNQHSQEELDEASASVSSVWNIQPRDISDS